MLSNATYRITQRSPKACQECTRRKVRCDKTVPCSRCQRLGKVCSREHVLTTKSIPQDKDSQEVHFLQRLLSLAGSGDAVKTQDFVKRRLFKLTSNISGEIPDNNESEPSKHEASTQYLDVRSLESQVWSRQSTSCYPHRNGCTCPEHRNYAELVSINCDMASTMIQWTSLYADPALYLTTANARKVVEFHVRYLWWHHNALHSSTFLHQCNLFWNMGTVTHPLWLALYISVISSTLWTLLNSPVHRQQLDIDIPEEIVTRQFQELLRILYMSDFLSNPSMYSIQAVVIATRYAHNIGFSDSVTNILASAVGLAQSMGLHHIDARLAEMGGSDAASFEIIERENGKRLWWQLVVQNYFAIPFTGSYTIVRKHFTTPVPMNCDDGLLEVSESMISLSSYTRCVSRESLLMPEALDGVLEGGNNHCAIHRHLNVMVDRLKQLISSFPRQFLQNYRTPDHPNLPWLPTARRTLAISVSDKIIMLYRPLLLHAFRTSEFQDIKQTCLSAALTILREYNDIDSALHETLSIWTQSAFCTTAAVVLGLALLYGDTGTESRHEEYLDLLHKTSKRLEMRRCDTMAAKCAKLIHALNAAYDDLAASEQLCSADDRAGRADKIIKDRYLLSQVISVTAPAPILPADWAFEDAASQQTDFAFDFDSWYDETFTY